MNVVARVATVAAIAACAACSTVSESLPEEQLEHFTGRIVRIGEMPVVDTSAVLQHQLGSTWTVSSVALTPSPTMRRYVVYRIRIDENEESAVATYDASYRVNDCVVVSHLRGSSAREFGVGEARLARSRDCPRGI